MNGGDRTWYLTMDMTQPPFDDIHVRKAMNLVMDLEGLQRAWGGPGLGRRSPRPSRPDGVLYGQLTNEDYQPYQKPPFAGDVEAAKAEMRQSKYDTDQDGTCDAAPCKGIVTINRNYGPWAAMTPIVTQGAAAIGIEVNIRELPTSPAYTTTQNPSRGIKFAANHGWGKDYADPVTFMVLFEGANILPSNNSNTALAGITQQIAQRVNVDRQIPRGRAERRRRHRRPAPWRWARSARAATWPSRRSSWRRSSRSSPTSTRTTSTRSGRPSRSTTTTSSTPRSR